LNERLHRKLSDRREKTEKKAQREAKAADKASKVPQATIAPEVRESRNTLGSAVSPPFGPSTSEKESKKKGASELETTKEDQRAVDASARPVTVPEPIVEGKKKKKSRKRKERDDAIDPARDTPGPEKKRKKEQGKGKEREKLAISEPTLVEATPVRADENPKPKKRKPDEDGEGAG